MESDVNVDWVLFDLAGTLLQEAGQIGLSEVVDLARSVCGSDGGRVRNWERSVEVGSVMEAIFRKDMTFLDQVVLLCRLEVAPSRSVDLESRAGVAVERWLSRSRRKAFPDALAAVNRLVELGIRIGVVSNTRRTGGCVCAELAGAGLLSSISRLFLSSELRLMKPDERFYNVVLASLGAVSSRVLVVGDDRICDYEAPSRLGIRSVLLKREDRNRAGKVGVINSLEELPELVSDRSKL